MQHNEYAIWLGGDEGVYVYGTVDSLREWLERIDKGWREIAEDAARPLTLADLTLDSDGDYVCPRCPDVYFSRQENLEMLYNLASKHIMEFHRPAGTE